MMFKDEHLHTEKVERDSQTKTVIHIIKRCKR